MRAITSRTSYGIADVRGDDAVELLRVVVRGSSGASASGIAGFDGVERRDDGPRELQRVLVVVGEVVGDAREPRVDVGAAQLLGA